MTLPSAWSVMRVAIPVISMVALLSVSLVGASQDSGSVIPAESTYLPCTRALLLPRVLCAFLHLAHCNHTDLELQGDAALPG